MYMYIVYMYNIYVYIYIKYNMYIYIYMYSLYINAPKIYPCIPNVFVCPQSALLTCQLHRISSRTLFWF